MQRGLRMCKTHAALWAEYFRMELLYAQKLTQRRALLQGRAEVRPPPPRLLPCRSVGAG